MDYCANMGSVLEGCWGNLSLHAKCDMGLQVSLVAFIWHLDFLKSLSPNVDIESLSVELLWKNLLLLLFVPSVPPQDFCQLVSTLLSVSSKGNYLNSVA